MPALGGRRGREKSVPENVNGLWENQSFHNYADFALGNEFRTGLEELVALGHERRTAIMCSEAVWWRCHRRLIAIGCWHAARRCCTLWRQAKWRQRARRRARCSSRMEAWFIRQGRQPCFDGLDGG
jgi:uncharacterized protein (DUF488 family)